MRFLRWLALLALLAAPGEVYADAFSSTPPPVPPDGATITVSSGKLVANNTGCSTSCTFTTTTLAGTTNVGPVTASGTFTGTIATLSSILVVAGTSTLANVTQGNAGAWNFTMHDAASGLLIKNNAGAIMVNFDGSSGLIKPLMPTLFNPTSSAVSGTWSLSSNPLTIQSPTWTGTVTAPNNFVGNYWTHTFNEDSGSAPNMTLQIQGNHGPLATGNTYTIDATTNMVSALTSTPATPIELHSGRFTTTANFTMGGTGTGALAKGTLIGVKCGANSTGNFIAESFACEVLTGHTGGSVENSYGVGILEASSIQPNIEYAGVAFAGSNIGYKNVIAMGTFTRGGPCGSAANCTLIGGQGLSGATYNIARGIDFRKMVASSNYYDDGHVTIGSTGIVTTSKLNLAGISTTCAAQPTGTVAVVASVFTLCP